MEIIIGPNMLLPSISQALKEERSSLPRAQCRNSRLHPFINCKYIVIANLLGRYAKSSYPSAHISVFMSSQQMGMNGIKIVLAHKNDRQLLERGEVQTFIKDPLVRCSVSEETNYDRILFLQSQRIRKTDCIGNRRSHHSGCAHDAVPDID